jgi:hypothetical protein
MCEARTLQKQSVLGQRRCEQVGFGLGLGLSLGLSLEREVIERYWR